MSSTARYPIRVVSRLTGIGIDTLRAWERRHGAVAPIREERGRMYTDAHIARLRLLRRAVEQGHRIGYVAGLADEALGELAAAGEMAMAAVDDGTERTRLAPAALTAALRDYDAAGIDREIARLAAVLRPVDLLQDVLMPALAQLGDDWQRVHAGIAREHLLSSTVRHLLGSFLRLHAGRAAPATLLFATPAGERHEIGTLGAAMVAAGSGLGVAYLGPDLPAADIVDSVGPAGAHVLVLGITKAPATKATERNLRTIVRDLPPEVELWAGGRGAEHHASIIAARGLVLGTYTGYQQELVRIGGHIA